MGNIQASLSVTLASLQLPIKYVSHMNGVAEKKH